MKTNTKRGFTFLEIMLVVMIIGLLGAVVGPRIVGSGNKARARTTKIQIDSLGAGLKMYALDVGSYPTTQQGLGALVDRPSDVDQNVWDGPYIEDAGGIPRDGFGREFKYEHPTQKPKVDYALWSMGLDGVDNTEDDITNWVKQ